MQFIILVYLDTCILAYLQTCTLIHLHTCIPAYLHTCIPAYLRTCLHVYLNTCILAYFRIFAYLHSHILAKSHYCIFAYLHIYIFAHSHDCLITWLHIYILAYLHSHILSTCILAYLHTCVPAHLYTCILAYLIFTHFHTSNRITSHPGKVMLFQTFLVFRTFTFTSSGSGGAFAPKELYLRLSWTNYLHVMLFYNIPFASFTLLYLSYLTLISLLWLPHTKCLILTGSLVLRLFKRFYFISQDWCASLFIFTKF